MCQLALDGPADLPEVTSQRLFGLIEAAKMLRVCPANTMGEVGLPLLMFHSLAVLSPLALASQRPSGLNATFDTMSS